MIDGRSSKYSTTMPLSLPASDINDAPPVPTVKPRRGSRSSARDNDFESVAALLMSASANAPSTVISRSEATAAYRKASCIDHTPSMPSISDSDHGLTHHGSHPLSGDKTLQSGNSASVDAHGATNLNLLPTDQTAGSLPTETLPDDVGVQLASKVAPIPNGPFGMDIVMDVQPSPVSDLETVNLAKAIPAAQLAALLTGEQASENAQIRGGQTAVEELVGATAAAETITANLASTQAAGIAFGPVSDVDAGPTLEIEKTASVFSKKVQDIFVGASLKDSHSSTVAATGQSDKLDVLDQPIQPAAELLPTSQRASQAPSPIEATGNSASVTLLDLPAKITRMAIALRPGESSQMRLRLDPPSLGTMHVQIDSTDRGVSVRIVSQSHEASRLLQESHSHLRDELSKWGLSLDSFSSSVGSHERSSTRRDWSQAPNSGLTTKSSSSAQVNAVETAIISAVPAYGGSVLDARA
jgi:hypothetical protein